MDKLIPDEIIRKQKRKRVILLALAFVALVTLIFSFRILVKPSVSKARITTFQVEEGPVDNTISASGEVLPEFEQVITSPIQSFGAQLSALSFQPSPFLSLPSL